MWFDPHRKLAEIAAHPFEPAKPAPHVAIVASVATPILQKPQSTLRARADGLEPDAGAYLEFLRLHGPATYGAMASELGWGATRAWRAEANLRAAGVVTMGPLGRAHPVAGDAP